MSHRLTPPAVLRARNWVILLATHDTAPAWSPVETYTTPEPLRAAAQWLVDHGYAPGMKHEMVCVLLALYAADLAPAVESGGAFIPQDAA